MQTLRFLFAIACLTGMLAGTIRAESPQQPEGLSRIAGWKGTSPNTPSEFRFVVVSDRTGGHVVGEWAAAVKQVNLLKPDFIMCVGDLIEGYTEDTDVLTEQWDEFDEIAHNLEAPFFYCSGNHDVTNDVMLKMFVERHGVEGRSYYSFDYRGCHFVVLDSHSAIRTPDFAKQQFEWLEKDLTASQDPKHVFVFYHHPLWKNEQLWGPLRAMLDPKKTTIFNGHWHNLNYNDDAQIPTYVLAATSANVGKRGRQFGEFRMFAQVSMDEDKPTIALLPLHEILPPEYAAFTTSVRKLSQLVSRVIIAPEGGTFRYRQPNTFEAPLTVEIRSDAPGWDVTPEFGKIRIAPGKTADRKYLFTRKTPTADNPRLAFTYTFANPQGKKITLEHSTVLTPYARMDIQRAKNIRVDGDLTEWDKEGGLVLNTSRQIFRGAENWDGPTDASCTFRATHDGKRLYIAVDVADDELITGNELPWRNDAIELFWDTRPANMQDGKHGIGTGQLILAVPAEGEKVRPYWKVHKRKALADLTVACAQRSDGYSFELSIPLTELGVKDDSAPGRIINLELQLDDRDKTITFMTTTGLPDSYIHTSGYARCTLK